MKKMVMITVFTVLVSTVFAENIQDEFLGHWSAEQFLIEQKDGLLVASEAAYSHPYLGITGMDFLDSSFMVFTVMDVEYRAFYEIEGLDFDNYNINCHFRNGEEFLLKLVRGSGGSWKYLYRVASSSVLAGGATETEEAVEEESDDAVLPREPEMSNLEVFSEPEEVFSVYIGTMKRR